LAGTARDFLIAQQHGKGEDPMATITTSDGVQIFYKDWGKGQPIVFSHGWPLTADAWDAQMLFFGQHGYRVIAHDRRGHGRSSQTWDGNDMDTYSIPTARPQERHHGWAFHRWW
jgi:non-heme chloroperoxidase